MIVKNRNGLLSILISVALNGEDASKLHLEKNVRSVQLASKSTNLRPGTQKTFGRKNTELAMDLILRLKVGRAAHQLFFVDVTVFMREQSEKREVRKSSTAAEQETTPKS